MLKISCFVLLKIRNTQLKLAQKLMSTLILLRFLKPTNKAETPHSNNRDFPIFLFIERPCSINANNKTISNVAWISRLIPNKLVQPNLPVVQNSPTIANSTNGNLLIFTFWTVIFYLTSLEIEDNKYLNFVFLSTVYLQARIRYFNLVFLVTSSFLDFQKQIFDKTWFLA